MIIDSPNEVERSIAADYICNAICLLLTAKDGLPLSDERIMLVQQIQELDKIRHQLKEGLIDARVNP